MARAAELSGIGARRRDPAARDQPARARPVGRATGLLAVLRGTLSRTTTRMHGANVGAPPRHFAEHHDEPVLSRQSARAETIPRHGASRSRGTPVREPGILRVERRQSPRLLVAA